MFFNLATKNAKNAKEIKEGQRLQENNEGILVDMIFPFSLFASFVLFVA